MNNEMLEIDLKTPDNFLKIKETLQRMGIASRDTKTLTQSCHILHKRERYYIVHFKELFILDNKENTLGTDDIKRRNKIAVILEDWGLLDIISEFDEESGYEKVPLKIISHKDRADWNLVSKYTIGVKK